MPLLPIMFLIFLVLKLTGFIAWSWLWVTAPLWGPLALGVVLWLIILGLAAVGIKRKSKRGAIDTYARSFKR